MDTEIVRACFTITFTRDQYDRAKSYVEDMQKHPQRIYWQGKSGRHIEDLVIEQITHRILSGFYNDDPLNAGRQIVKLESMPISL